MLPEQWNHLLEQEFHFHALSKPLGELGLNYLHLTGVNVFDQNPTIISNDIVIALEQFRSHEHESHQFVLKWLKTLSSSCSTFSDKQLKTKVQSIVQQAKCFSKNKQTDSLDIFLKRTFPDVPVPVPSVKPVSNELCKECEIKEKTIKNLQSENKRLTSDVNVLNSEISSKNEILSDIKQLRISNENLEANIKEIKSLMKNVTVERDHLLEEVENIKKSKMYRTNFELRKKIKEMEEEEANLITNFQEYQSKLSNLNDTLNTLKKKLKSEQSLKAGFKKSLQELMQENKELKKILTISENDNEIFKLRESGKSHRFSDSVRKTYYALQGSNVAGTDCSKVISTVAKHLFDHDIREKDLPSASSSLNFANEANIIAKEQIVQEIKHADHFTYACDGTSRDKAHYLEKHILLSSGKKLSLGYSQIACDDSETLLERCINSFKDIVELHCLDEDELKDEDLLLKEIISKMKCLMTDRASVCKAFDAKMANFKNELLGGEDAMTHFLFCNAHLLALSAAAENALTVVEEEEGGNHGRDAKPAFSGWQSKGEAAAIRLIRLAASIVGPRCDEKSGCRQEWLAFCSTIGKKSIFTSYRSNRFNNLFHNATALLQHRNELET